MTEKLTEEKLADIKSALKFDPKLKSIFERVVKDNPIEEGIKKIRKSKIDREE